MKAMILAAGKGTRMLPLTGTVPKPLIEIQGVSLLEHTIQYLKYHHFNEIIINIHHYPEQIVDFVKRNHDFGIHIEFSDESDQLLDTGGGLYKARRFFNDHEPFLLTSSDVITDLDLNTLVVNHKANHALVTLAVKHRKSTRDFIFDCEYRLCGWHNKNTGETRLIRNIDDQIRAAFSTIHVIDPSLFELITERGCFSIIDLYLRLALNHRIMGFEHDNSTWFECGRFENIQQLNGEQEIGNIYKEFHT